MTVVETSVSVSEQLIQDWLRRLSAAGRRDATRKQREYGVRKLLKFYPDLTTVTPRQLEVVLATYRHIWSDEYRKGLLASWRGFYGFAVDTGAMDQNPAAGLLPIYVRYKPARVADDDDLKRALRTATLPERAMVLLGRYAALRLTEITTLHPHDREGDMLRVLGKGGKTRMVPINQELMLVLERLEKHVGNGYYFPGLAGPHMHPQAVCKVIKRVTGWNPHALRHAAATAAYRGTHDIRAVQQLLGHESILTTQRYLHVDADEIRAAAHATAFGDASLLDASPIERAAFDSPKGTPRI